MIEVNVKDSYSGSCYNMVSTERKKRTLCELVSNKSAENQNEYCSAQSVFHTMCPNNHNYY